MIVYTSVASYFCTPLNRKINIGTLVAKYENVRKLVIVFNPGEKGIEYLYNDYKNALHDVFQTEAKWFYALADNPEFFTLTATYPEDIFGNVSGTIGWANGLPNANMRQMSDGTVQVWDFGLSAWVIPVLKNGVMEYLLA